MALLRSALTALMFLILVSGCAGSAGHRNLVRPLVEMGCNGAPEAEYQQVGSRVVLSVSVQECAAAHPRRAGELLARAEAVRAMARAIWSTPTSPFDSILVTVYRTADEPRRTRPQSVLVEREELAADFGPRDAALDTPRLFGDGGRAAWIYLPPLAAVGGVLLFAGMVRAIRAGRVLPILIIRR